MDSTSQSPIKETTAEGTGGGPEAFFLLTADGRVANCSEWAEAWWRTDATGLAGRPFPSLFFFEAPGGPGDNPAADTWALLAAAASVRTLALQARAEGDTFESLVRVAGLHPPMDSAAWIAYVTRPGALAVPAAKPPAARAESSTATFAGPGPWDALVHGSVGLFQLDLVESTARFSEAWKRLLGYEPEDLAPEPDTLSALIHPDDSEAAPHVFDGMATEGFAPFSCEVRMRAKDDTWRWVQLECVRRFDADGTLVDITGIMIDAQERHEAEEAAQLNEERFLQLTSRGSAGFFQLDFEEDSAWFSPEFRQALGLRPAELPATIDAFMDLLDAEQAAAGPEAFFKALTEEAAGGACHYTLRHTDGRTLPFDAIIATTRGRHGALRRVAGLQVPATRRHAPDEVSPEAIERSRARIHAFGEILEIVGEGVVLIDKEGTILHANARAAQTIGASASDLAGRTWAESFAVIDRVTEIPAPDPIERVLSGGPPLDLDHSFTFEGLPGHVEIALTCRPLLDARDRLAGAIVVFRKPSEMPLSPAELLSSNRMEALGRLACGIAHDFNNLLTTITGGISLALEKRDMASLQVANKACNSARHLARQLLTFARGDPSDKKVLQINDTIRETARMTGAGSKTTIELELTEDLHPVCIDPARIVQVFTNLILNAMQVMPEGGRIWVRSLNMPLGRVNTVSLPPGDYVRIDVQDNGPGIPPENLERVFEPFFTTRREGTGLGLPMVRSIIAQHEGAIEAVSTVGSGTTFTIYLPRASMQPVEETPPPPPVVTHGSGRILLMDDDPDLCMIAQGMLEMLGYEPEAVQTAADAITAFRRGRELGRTYAAVILDLTMAGGLGGEEVFSRLREIDPEVKAIVSSGYATEDHGQKYLAKGFSGVLAKPYRSADLGRVLKAVITGGA